MHTFNKIQRDLIMKKLFYEPDLERLDLFQRLLDKESISTTIQVPHLSEIEPPLPLPKCFPYLCVLDDNDYPQAIQCIREYLYSSLDKTAQCPFCREVNPAGFIFCWSCDKPVPKKEKQLQP